MILHNMKQRILSSVMWFASILTFLPLAGLGWFFTSCSEDDSDAPLTFYSSVRLTAAGFIEADEAQFSEFKAILEKGNYLGMLKTYGSYTVFAPTNSAIQQYLQENGYASVDELPVEKCDTLSRTHIIQGKAVFTSDIGMIDEEGMLHLKGREDDVINVGGFKVAPTEVEDAAMSFPPLKDCICISADHPITGKALKLLVAMKEGETLNKRALALHLKERLENYKIPLLYEQVESIQRTFNGKLNRKFYA